jgi:hypothetical protein
MILNSRFGVVNCWQHSVLLSELSPVLQVTGLVTGNLGGGDLNPML